MFQHLYIKLAAIFLCFFLYLPNSMAANYQLQQLEIIQPWSRATPSNAKVAGGYIKIINKSDSADKLLAIKTPISDNAQIHSMEMADGVMKMRPLPDGLTIPAKTEIELKPNSYHIMFKNLQAGLNQGEEFTATLFFEKAGSINVTFKVAPMGVRSFQEE